jgi:hypothetical protein
MVGQVVRSLTGNDPKALSSHKSSRQFARLVCLGQSGNRPIYTLLRMAWENLYMEKPSLSSKLLA